MILGCNPIIHQHSLLIWLPTLSILNKPRSSGKEGELSFKATHQSGSFSYSNIQFIWDTVCYSQFCNKQALLVNVCSPHDKGQTLDVLIITCSNHNQFNQWLVLSHLSDCIAIFSKFDFPFKPSMSWHKINCANYRISWHLHYATSVDALGIRHWHGRSY